MRSLILVLTPLILCAADAPPVVRASGTGLVSLKPDQATVTIGVVTQAPTAEQASAQNAKQLTSVLEQLKKQLGSAAEIRTSGYSLNPNYKYGNNTAPTIAGYSATNAVLVKVDDLARLGPVLDAATQSGANSVQGISFGLKNERAAHAQALAEATRNARANAEAIAGALGLHVTRVQSVESMDAAPPVPIRPQFAAMAAEARAPTPIESGSIDVRATVTITLEVAQ